MIRACRVASVQGSSKRSSESFHLSMRAGCRLFHGPLNSQSSLFIADQWRRPVIVNLRMKTGRVGPTRWPMNSARNRRRRRRRRNRSCGDDKPTVYISNGYGSSSHVLARPCVRRGRLAEVFSLFRGSRAGRARARARATMRGGQESNCAHRRRRPVVARGQIDRRRE